MSLALAIGANTTIFSIAKQLLFERLDIPDAASLRLLTATDASFSYPVYAELRSHNRVLGDLLAFHVTAAKATVGDNAERVLIHQVSGNYYDVLGVTPQLGRGIRSLDDTGASDVVAVISDFTALISIAMGVLFGFAPALAALRAPLAAGVKQRGAVGRSVVGFQIALAALLVISAGLFIRSLAGLTAVNPGFHTDHLLLAQIVLPQNRYPAGANVAFHQRMEQTMIDADLAGESVSLSAAPAPLRHAESLLQRP